MTFVQAVKNIVKTSVMTVMMKIVNTMKITPLGADPRSPEYQPIDKYCPRCGEVLTQDYQRVKVKGRWYEWIDLYCGECKWVDSNEPDWDDV
jgi:lysyl-tRNA synthetase class I